MNIIPKLLYLFQNIPLPPPINLFTQLKKLLVSFLWNNRHPRHSCLYCPCPIIEGGSKPTLVLLSSTLKNFTEREAPLWKEMEEL